MARKMSKTAYSSRSTAAEKKLIKESRKLTKDEQLRRAIAKYATVK